jgi:hypothetical protein
MAETVEVVFDHHHADRRDRENVKHYVPGDRAPFDAATARQLVAARVATYATKTEAKAAGEPDAPTAGSK